jgi:hypothetical protein
MFKLTVLALSHNQEYYQFGFYDSEISARILIECEGSFCQGRVRVPSTGTST